MRDAIKALHDSPVLLSAITTGAGAGLQKLLWEVAGSSRTILSFHLPYATESLSALLGFTPFKFVSRPTAVAMAKRALDEAQAVARHRGVPLIGLGVTAAVSTDRDRKGRDEAWMSVATPTRVFSLAVEFDKAEHTRESEGRMIDLIALNLVMEAAGLPYVPYPTDIGRYRMSPIMEEGGQDPLTLWDKPLFLRDGHRGTVADLKPDEHLIFPGSFNPLHEGHKGMADMAQRVTGKTVVFNITNAHPDKGSLSDAELLRRGQQFIDYRPVIFTRSDSLFYQKARQFQGFSFLVGADTAQAILTPSYYGPDDDIGRGRLLQVLDEFANLGVTFYVAGRVVDGKFIDPENLEFPSFAATKSHKHLFKPIGGRWDIRSRDLR